uniref:Uncharacterized protein n=1 Tax=Anopheles atroparvus TaxID=41427 RepID=A0A182JG35_ANOAO
MNQAVFVLPPVPERLVLVDVPEPDDAGMPRLPVPVLLLAFAVTTLALAAVAALEVLAAPVPPPLAGCNRDGCTTEVATPPLTFAAVVGWPKRSGGLEDGLGVLGSPTSDRGGLSTGSAGDDLMIGTISVEANATSRSNPELTRSCQLDSSSPTTSSGGEGGKSE